MRQQILEIFKKNPKGYVNTIKKNADIVKWVNYNSLIQSDKFVEMIYSAVYQKTNICECGKIMKFDRFSTGFKCGPAGVCEITKKNISNAVSKTKQNYTLEEKEIINLTRENTMSAKYGVKYNSQREDIKHIWTKSKISNDAYNKLTDKNWLDNEYNQQKKSLIEIADSLGVYYSTVAEYCKKFNFNIRKTSSYSLCEKKIVEYIQEFNVECIENDWDILSTSEIDILLPSVNLGIEVNGLYWHSYHPSINKIENKFRHIQKTENALEKNINLLHITDYEWNNSNNKIKNLIKTKLQLNEKIYARKCSISTVTNAESKLFLINNHLQQHIPAKYKVGLYYNNKLVMLVTYGKSRFSKKYDFEIYRVCTEPGISVVGGLSKLMTHIKKQHNNKKFITYCDRAKSNGNGYIQAGFKFIKSTGPGYFWTNGNEIISRYKCQKKNLSKWLLTFDPLKSESENLFLANYRRYWDCGNLVFEY